jgi:hypothetical protein
VEIILGQARRRWSEDEKRALVAGRIFGSADPGLVAAVMKALPRR